MVKIPTNWSTNNVKNPTRVAPVLKGQSSWNGVIAKSLTKFTESQKNVDSWGHATAKQTYTYNDRFTYNDPLVTYNFLLNTNTANQLGQTVWKQS